MLKDMENKIKNGRSPDLNNIQNFKGKNLKDYLTKGNKTSQIVNDIL